MDQEMGVITAPPYFHVAPPLMSLGMVVSTLHVQALYGGIWFIATGFNSSAITLRATRMS